MSVYRAVFNNVKVEACDFNFLTDELGNHITIDSYDKNFKSTNHLVTLDEPSCQTYDKTLFSATIKKSTYRAVISVIQ